MLSTIRKLFRAPGSAPQPSVPPGERVYAIGDIHGCDAQFGALIDAIEADDSARGPTRTTVILLGDLVDRGPDSAGVIRRARDWQSRRTVRMLAGNHEEMFLLGFAKTEVLRSFLRYGGRETLLSYPIDPAAYADADFAETQRLMTASVPVEDREFLEAFEDSITIGDYHFVHAGIRPGVALEDQKRSDLRWIREPFLDSRESHGAVIVHGHTIFDEPDVQPNRIGIDTGAYASGRLTALGLEATDRWLLETTTAGSAVTVTQRTLP